MTRPNSVEEYLAALSPESCAVLQELRATIKAAAPEAAETIAYDIPGFRHQGRLLVSYAAFRDHFSLFPASSGVREALGEELKPFISGKGTIRFSTAKPLPVGLVARIVRVRIEENTSPSGR